jgi:hypothetical protein
MRNTADVTGGKPIAVLLQFISGVSAINPLVAFYDIHGRKREVLFFLFIIIVLVLVNNKLSTLSAASTLLIRSMFLVTILSIVLLSNNIH